VVNEVAIGQAVGGNTTITAGGVWDHAGDMTTDKMVTVGPNGHVRSVTLDDATAGIVNNIATNVTNRTALTTAIIDEGMSVGPDGRIDVNAGPGIIINGSNQVQANVDETSLTINPGGQITVNDGGITNVHLADNSVDTTNIINGTILEEDLSDGLQNKIGDIDKNKEGIALAMAMQAPYVERDRRFGVSGGLGYYEGRAGFGGSAALRVNSHWQVSAGVAVGFKHGTVGGRVGNQLSW
jgi:hypothetical protein